MVNNVEERDLRDGIKAAFNNASEENKILFTYTLQEFAQIASKTTGVTIGLLEAMVNANKGKDNSDILKNVLEMQREASNEITELLLMLKRLLGDE